MKIERVVVALFMLALIVRVLSVYYAYENFAIGEDATSIARHTRRVIDTVYTIKLHTLEVENTSAEYIRSGEPYYAWLMRRNAAKLNRTVHHLIDSVKGDLVESQKANELLAQVTALEKALPDTGSLNRHFSELTPAPGKILLEKDVHAVTDTSTHSLNVRTQKLEYFMNVTLSNANEIITEEIETLDVWRKSTTASRRNVLNVNTYGSTIGLIFVFIILFAFNKDIQRRKLAEVKTKESEEKLRQMIEEVGDVIYSCDYTGKFIFINACFETLTGYSLNELLVKDIMFVVHPDWVKNVREFYFNQFKNRIHETQYEFPIITRQGETKWVEQSAVLMKKGDMVEIFQCVVRDITRRKEAEENMKNALEKEKQINELKSRFVSLASHEFRTPLSTILSSSELIEEYIEHDGKNNAALIKDKNIHHLKRIKSAVQNMVTILNNFLSLDQLEQGKTLTTPLQFNVNSLSHEIINELQGKLKKGQKIAYTPLSAATDIFVDRAILKNVMINLLTNAIKYSPENSVIKCTTNVTKNGLEFVVEDSGIGIPEPEQANLFERFFRAKNTLNIEGTGLGLSIVKKYVDLLNGHISFTSRENEGSIFKVFIANADQAGAAEYMPSTDDPNTQ